METVSADGVHLSALALGAPDDPAVVMLHGLVSGNLSTWYSRYALPLARSHRVLLYDLRGHGDSDVTADGYDLDRHAEDLQAVIDHFVDGDRPVSLVGHSLGALIALHHALQRRRSIEHLVLIDAPMPASAHVAPSLRGVVSRDALTRYIDDTLVARHGLRGRRRDRLQTRLAQLFFDTSLVDDVAAMDAEDDAALAALDTPTTLLYGDDSPCLDSGEHLARVLPNATLRRLPGGHYLPEESPETLLPALQAALTSAALASALQDSPP